MTIHWILFCILFPLVGGAVSFGIPFKNRRQRCVYVQVVVMINALVTGVVLFTRPTGILTFLKITNTISLSFHVDGLGTVFAALVSVLWPLATLYAFSYMKHEENEGMFFAFYLMTYGITLGIAFSENPLTLYLFYEFLTLITTPLVFHTQTKEAIRAARKYLYYSVTGAAIGFVAVIFVLIYGGDQQFAYGGMLDVQQFGFSVDLIRIAYVLAFIGFGVKAALVPLHGWLPSASVAPTPVTALLHAVAVVKAGVFVIMRMTYYVFGTEILQGSWAQTVVTVLAAVTVLYGSTMAVKEQHFKRRLAYSTISNLSYILLGVTLMSPFGFLGALTHMVFHAIMKISAFFCAGAIMQRGELQNVSQLEGMGRKMPFTFTCFTVAALSLVGMPPLIGFASKYNLLTAAVARATPLAYLTMGVLLVSSLLVAVYLLFPVVRAFFPANGAKVPTKGSDPDWLMKLPIGIFTVLIVGLGVYAQPILTYLTAVASGRL